jgi:hypothetical protein
MLMMIGEKELIQRLIVIMLCIVQSLIGMITLKKRWRRWLREEFKVLKYSWPTKDLLFIKLMKDFFKYFKDRKN